MATFRWPVGWDPFGGLRVMQRELDRLVARTGLGESQRVGGGTYPPVNVLNGPDELVVQCEVAGVKRAELDLSITGETLVVKGAKQTLEEGGEVRYQRRERGVGDFSRTIVLPDKIDPDKVEATLNAGILTIRLPKSEAARPKQIKVR